MLNIGETLLGLVLVALALLGLLMASRAVDATFYWTGLGTFVVCVLFVFARIASRTGGNGPA